MKFNKIIFMILVFVCMSSCTYSVHLVQTSEDPPIEHPKKYKEIHADAKQFVVLGFANETEYVNQALQELKSKCEQGSIYHITTKYYTDHGFLSWTNHISLDGQCTI